MVVYTNQEYWYNDGLSFSCTKNTQIVYLSTSMTPTAFDIAYLPFSNSGNVQSDVGIGHNVYFIDTTGQDNLITIQPQSGEYVNGTYSYSITNPAFTTTLCTNLGLGIWSILNTANILGGVGSQGPTGPQGLIGPQGSTGSFSFTFSATGNQGPTGPAGSNGAQGPQGPQGFSGATGSIGPMGASQGSISVLFNGNGANITLGSKGYVTIPYDATITQWSLVSTATGSITIDVDKGSYASFPVNSSIAGTDLPKLTNQNKNLSTALTGWTTSIAANDVLEFVVLSNSGITLCNLNLRLSKSV